MFNKVIIFFDFEDDNFKVTLENILINLGLSSVVFINFGKRSFPYAFLLAKNVCAIYITRNCVLACIKANRVKYVNAAICKISDIKEIKANDCNFFIILKQSNQEEISALIKGLIFN